MMESLHNEHQENATSKKQKNLKALSGKRISSGMMETHPERPPGARKGRQKQECSALLECKAHGA